MADATYDAIIIGGGPAGSTAGGLLAQYGHRVLIVERERFPRFHIGESLMPETYWTFRRLGMLEQLRKSAFPEKYSVQFVSESGRDSQPFYFDEHNPHECSQTWQVLRSEFDKMMLENARRLGAEVRQGVRVTEVLFDGQPPHPALSRRGGEGCEGQRAAGVRAQEEGKPPEEIRCRVVVDASGQSALLANRFKMRERDPKLRKGAVWTYYRGAARDPGKNGGATLVIYTQNKRGWFWFIPLPDNVTSIGVVSDLDYLFNGRGSHEQIFFEEVERCPGVKARIAHAERCDGFRATKDFSYRSSRPAGDGWVLVGDALGFLDPIYSSGVFLALKSGELAADAVHEGLEKGDLSAAQLGRWAPGFLKGMELMRKLVYAFYTPGFSFGRFIREHPHHVGSVTDLLIGNLFTPGVEKVFDDMAGQFEDPEPLFADRSAS